MKQEIRDPRRVVVLIEEADGSQVGWDVFDVSTAQWAWAGLDRNGARATITVTGSFHRIGKSPEEGYQEALDQAGAELVEPPREIGGPDGGRDEDAGQ